MDKEDTHPGWKIIRLELARTRDFPEGSPRHTVLLRVPLLGDGIINADEVARHPSMATVTRSWPERPDQHGYVIRSGPKWAFSYAIGEDDDEALFHLEAHPLRQGEYLTMTEPDGERLPFRVARISAVDEADRALIPRPPGD